jgi:hypothetical protein
MRPLLRSRDGRGAPIAAEDTPSARAPYPRDPEAAVRSPRAQPARDRDEYDVAAADLLDRHRAHAPDGRLSGPARPGR